MDDLLKSRARAAEYAKRQKKKERRKAVMYDLQGKVIHGGGKAKKIFMGLVTIIAVLLLLIYIPPLFFREKGGESYDPLPTDATAIKTYQTYLKDSPELDFDNDGLSNDKEEEYGTNIWKIDSDGDGVTDSCEINITETSPTSSSDVLAQMTAREDEEKGTSVGTPYKIDDIIMWPDNYSSKAYGGVVRTMYGYRFCYFTGWVKFPVDGYAYKYVNGRHVPLQHREAENAWKIEDSSEVRLFSAPLEYFYALNLPFLDTIYMKEDNTAGKVLNFILPEKGGFVNCTKSADIDINPEESPDTVTEIRMPFINRDDIGRFSKNMISLSDLSTIRNQIASGNCVAVSLYSQNVGESIGIIYGYDARGNLLIANEELQPAGKILVSERAKKIMDKDGNVGQYTWYEWAGMGFSSAQGDRICFFSATSEITGGDAS